MFPLHLFPPGLEGTLLVPVLVGVMVMLILHDCWGWDFVGLVVPGYLCSVLMLQPLVAAVVVVEAVATWGLARGLDAAGVRLRLTYPVFGRDRFYTILVASIVVRVVIEAVVLQRLAGRLAPHWPLLAAHRHELFGIGLVLAPLTANRFWRGGVGRGLFQLGVETALVWLVVGVVLARTTNFSLAGFELAYDHLALSFLSSPQAQITLIVSAALASFLNRRYGWDFHGILVPALLALAVVTPLKLAATVVEALVVMALGRALVALPVGRGLDVEGPRRVALCLTAGFVVKLIVAVTLTARWPGYRPSDFFGFGYLVPSLLAERIWVRHRPALVLLPTLQTSLAGLVLSAGVLRLVAAVSPATASPPAAAPALVARAGTGVLEKRSVAGRALALLSTRSGAAGTAPAEAIEAAAEAMQEGRSDGQRLARSLAPLGLGVAATSDGLLLVSGPGWPSTLLRPEPHAVVAAAHANELHADEAALWAGALLNTDVVLPTGADSPASALAVALRDRAALPVLFVRGAAALPGGEVLVIPRPAGRVLPPWLAPLVEALAARFPLSAARGLDVAPLTDFPAVGDASLPAALIWLSPEARRALGDAAFAWAARLDVGALAADRGVAQVHTALTAWLTASTGGRRPPAIESDDVLALVEPFARSRDVARLRAPLVLLLDDARGLAAVGVEKDGRRVVAVLGERVERRVATRSPVEAARALDLGARTLIGGGER
jgi:hypothetical protein